MIIITLLKLFFMIVGIITTCLVATTVILGSRASHELDSDKIPKKTLELYKRWGIFDVCDRVYDVEREIRNALRYQEETA